MGEFPKPYCPLSFHLCTMDEDGFVVEQAVWIR